VLTGTFIKGEVFWYNELAIWKIRFSSIPLEDFAYAFDLILLNILCINKLQTILKPSLKSTHEN
jgi:hypothetical protein